MFVEREKLQYVQIFLGVHTFTSLKKNKQWKCFVCLFSIPTDVSSHFGRWHSACVVVEHHCIVCRTYLWQSAGNCGLWSSSYRSCLGAWLKHYQRLSRNNVVQRKIRVCFCALCVHSPVHRRKKRNEILNKQKINCASVTALIWNSCPTASAFRCSSTFSSSLSNILGDQKTLFSRFFKGLHRRCRRGRRHLPRRRPSSPASLWQHNDHSADQPIGCECASQREAAHLVGFRRHRSSRRRRFQEVPGDRPSDSAASRQRSSR